MPAPRNYIMVCDERGTTRWPSRSKTWALGGYVIHSANQEAVRATWGETKRKLCGDPSRELKWSHFFPGGHQKKGKNPLVSEDPTAWRPQAIWAIRKLFEVPGVVPITTYVRKDEASDSVFLPPDPDSQTTYKVLDIATIWVTIYGQFALFLHERRTKGEIWFDRLGSSSEEQRRQDDWGRLRNDSPLINSDRREMIKRIAGELKFFDSRTNPLVQVADFISGVIWAAAEGDEVFLLQSLKDYFPTGPATYTLLRVQ